MDITQRKLAEQALSVSEEGFRKQYKSFPLPTYSWLQVGDDLILQDFNVAAEAATNGRIVDALGATASAWYVDQPEILLDLNACLAEQRTIRRELRYRYRTTGQERQLVGTCVFVPPRTVMVHTEDVTNARPAEQRLEALGCDLLQGYLFAKPLPAQELVDLLAADQHTPNALAA